MTTSYQEVEVQEICEGDSIVFTKNNDDTKDIVTSILTKLFQDGWLDDSSKKNYISRNGFEKCRLYRCMEKYASVFFE